MERLYDGLELERLEEVEINWFGEIGMEYFVINYGEVEWWYE